MTDVGGGVEPEDRGDLVTSDLREPAECNRGAFDDRGLEANGVPLDALGMQSAAVERREGPFGRQPGAGQFRWRKLCRAGRGHAGRDFPDDRDATSDVGSHAYPSAHDSWVVEVIVPLDPCTVVECQTRTDRPEIEAVHASRPP